MRPNFTAIIFFEWPITKHCVAIQLLMQLRMAALIGGISFSGKLNGSTLGYPLRRLSVMPQPIYLTQQDIWLYVIV